MINSSKTILLVEDEAIIAVTHKKILGKYGFNVISVATGEKAVEVVASTPGIDLILMDIDLGEGIDGTEVAEQILADKEIPLVFLSSHTEPEVVNKTEGITSYGYVVKNFGETVLIAAIKMAFRLHEYQIINKEKQLELEKQTHALNESIKELNCLCSISETAEKHAYSLNEILRKTAKLLPTAMQFPDETYARVTHEDDVYLSDGFRETGFKISTDIYCLGEKAGYIEIFMDKDIPALESEQKLLNTVSELIGRIITKQYLKNNILETSERERITIGQNLHDSVGQDLTGAAFLFQVIIDNTVKGVMPEIDQLKIVKNLIDAAKEHIHLLSDGLAPVNIEKDGIITALNELCQRVKNVYKINCNLKIDNIQITDNTIATHIFYIIQESVNNSFKHGSANNIEISVKKKTGKLEIIIKDDGTGLNKTQSGTKGLGLEFMKYRVNIIGGEIDFSFLPGSGATVYCLLNSTRWCN